MKLVIKLLLSILSIGNVIAAPNKARGQKGKAPYHHHDHDHSRGRSKLSNWDFTILGHRGGSAGFIPEHSLMSFTIGAQHGADYLEPDITFTSDGIQIIRHHPNLAEATNVDQVYGIDSDKYTADDTIEYYWRTLEEGGPSEHPYLETSGGYFSWNFTYDETQKLSLISDDLAPSPFDLFDLKIMRLQDLLILIRDELSPTLNRPIGLIPEIKYPHEYSKRLGEDVELLHLELLSQYGYLRKENGYYYVTTLCEIALTECDSSFNAPSVIIQSFNAPSLKIFKQYTNAPLIYLCWYDYDLMDKVFIDWVKTFANGLGVNTPGIEIMKQTVSNDNDDFVIFEYTLGFNVSHYFDSINSGIVDGVWTDDTDTARVIQETLDYVSQNGIKIKGSQSTEMIWFGAGIILGSIATICIFVVVYVFIQLISNGKLTNKMHKHLYDETDDEENDKLNGPH